MNHTEIDLLQYKENNELILKLAPSLFVSLMLWTIIVIHIWMNYKGNRLNYYQETSYMVFFVIMIFEAVYISHKLNLRTNLYFILAFFSMLVYLDKVALRIPIIDIILEYTLRGLARPVDQEDAASAYYAMKNYIGDSFYEALLTWVIIDVPFQIFENEQVKRWETSVKYVYHSISNQIVFFSSINNDISTIYIQNNQVRNKEIESFCENKIKHYSRKLLFRSKKSPSYKQYLQTKEQYEYLLFLLQEIRSNLDELDGREYLKLLYEAEAIFRRSKIINASYSDHGYNSFSS